MESLKSLISPISSALPCGPFIDDDDDLENEFIGLEAACRSQQAMFSGDDNEGSEDTTDWRDVIKRCQSISEQTKDIRVIIYLIKSLLNVEGLSGFSNSLNLLRKTLEEHWKEVYPILDDANDDNPWRIMCLNELGGEDIRRGLHAQPLVKSRAAGVFSLRDIKVAKGKIVPLEGSAEVVHDLAIIEGAFSDAEPENLQENISYIDGVLGDLSAIESFIKDSECSHVILSWKELLQTLHEIKAIYQEFCLPEASEDDMNEGDEIDAGSLDNQPLKKKAAALSGSINSREDVVKMLGKINEYYTKQEPSSPLPLLINRAKRLVHMDFMSILRDISPDGVSQAELIAGEVDEE